MNRLFLALAFFALTLTTANAQDGEEQEINTLFGGGEVHHSGYGGPSVKFTQFNDEFSMMVGGRGGWTINKQFTLGLAGYGLVTWPTIDYIDEDGNPASDDFHFGYGGVYLEYIHQPTDLIHFSGNVLIGGGGSMLDMYDYDHWDDGERDGPDNPWQAYFIIEPTLAVHLNVTTFFRVSLEASYRWVDEIKTSKNYESIDALKDIQMSSLSGALTLQFGSF